MKKACILLLFRIPLGVPTLCNSYSQSNRADFLSQAITPFIKHYCYVSSSSLSWISPSHRPWSKSLKCRPTGCISLLYVECFGIRVILLSGVGNGRFKKLCDNRRRSSPDGGKNRKGFFHSVSSYQIKHHARLLRRCSCVFGYRL